MFPISPSKRPSGKFETSAQWNACGSGSERTAASLIFNYRCCPIASLRIDPIPKPASAPVHAVIPRNSQRARFGADDNCITFVKAIEVVHIHCEALDTLPFAPGTHHQSPATFYNA